MTIQELYNFLQPLTQPLGTICLFLMSAGILLAALIWFVRQFWGYIVAAGVLAMIVAFMGMSLGVV